MTVSYNCQRSGCRENAVFHFLCKQANLKGVSVRTGRMSVNGWVERKIMVMGGCDESKEHKK